MIYSHSDVNFLLGVFINKPELCLNVKYKLEKDDLSPSLFQKIIYSVVFNLASGKCKNIDYVEINEFLKKYPSQYQVYKDNDGDSYVCTIKELSEDKLDNIEYYYGNIKKLSYIREAREDGDDISFFWDENKTDTDNLSKVDSFKMEDIIEYYEKKIMDRKHKYQNKKVKEEYLAGTDFMKTKEECKLTPMLGNSFQSEYLNGIFRGMYGFIIRTAKSGGGKSVLSLGDLCQTCILEYWDFEQQKFVKNESRVGAGLFINTELDLRFQLDVATIAWISGVERDHIANGEYLDGEEERVDYANEVLLRSELYFVDDPYFTCSSLEETIKYYAYNKNALTVCFDYISDNNWVSKEIANETKVPQRQDMVLLELTARLKQIQLETGVCLISACQTNGKEDTMDYPTSSCMAGGQSQERKTDGVLFMLPPTKKELEATSPILARVTKSKFKMDVVPNNVCHIVKGRNSKYEKHIKIFQVVDLGTLRSVDLYCTDKNNQPIKVEPLKILANN